MLFNGQEGDLNRIFWLGLGKKKFLDQTFSTKQIQL